MKPIERHSDVGGAGTARQAPRLRALPVAVALLVCLAGLCAAAALLVCLAAPLAAQTSTAPTMPARLWAAQTGPDQVTLAWDSIPGANEYLIYGAPADSVVGNLRLRPALQRLSGRSRGAVLFGVRRLSSGITLVAMAANGRALHKAQFNPVAPATSFSPIQPPEEVTAEATSATEITLSWTPVPGATAYYIGRAVAPGGRVTLCAVCSTATRYVDQNVTPGAATSYTVAAIFPTGRSQPAPSNEVTPGVTQLATTAGLTTSLTKDAPGTTMSGTTPPTTSTSYSTASYDPTTGLVTTVTTTTTCTTTTPTTCTTSTSTAISRPPTSTSPTTSTPTNTSSTTSTPTNTTSSSSGTSGSSPTSSSTTQSGLGGLLGGLTQTLPTVNAPIYLNAIPTGPGTVKLDWPAAKTVGITQYRISRRVNGSAWDVLNAVGGNTLVYTDAFFPITMFAAGPVRVTYNVVAVQNNLLSDTTLSHEVTVQPPTPTTTTATSCKLDYQRADNMWAAFGRPDGFLGTETISLASGQDKVFITDWAYEKQRNDGTNYYGSHLRVATNPTTRTVRLQLRTLTLTGLTVFLRTGSDTFWIRLDPGKTQQLQADLMEVFCEN